MKKQVLLAILTTSMLLTACGSHQTTTTVVGANTPQSESTDIASDVASDEASNPADTEDTTGSSDSAAEASGNASTTANTDTTTDSAASELPADSIGAVALYPNDSTYPLVFGSHTINAYFQRSGVIPGNGKLAIHNAADDSVVETIDLTASERCLPQADDSVLALLGWENGTRLAIHVNEQLKAGQNYYITLEEGAFTSSDGVIRSKVLDNKTGWSFPVANYGIKPYTPSGSDVFVDDVLYADILIADQAEYAKIENYDENRVRFNDKVFEKSGKLEIKIYQIGEDPFTVNFYDKEDDLIGSVTLYYNASIRPDPKEELQKPTVSNL